MVRLFGYIGFALLLLITSLSCDSSEPLINNGNKLTLALEDSSSTELWLNLTSANIPLPISLSLSQDNSVIQTINLCCNDTLLYIDSLLPKNTYKFKAEATNYQLPASNELTAQTMDTTSHEFTWQTFEFGDAGAGSSVLYDVAIIDENNIWAVGEIYMNDSLGNPDPIFYNAIHWDGNNWELKRILYEGNIWSIKTIFAFNENDIWFSAFVRYLNGQFIDLQIPDILMGWGVNKIWGTSSEDLYVVGNEGNIAHYGGASVGWQKIESGTDLDINDIWGDYNEKSGEWEILAVAANVHHSFERVVLKIDNNISQIISSEPIEWSLRTVWFNSDRLYCLAGSGIYKKHYLFDQYWQNRVLEITTYYTYRIRGNNVNDIIGVGAFGDVIHYNGLEWKNDYTEPTLLFGSYFSVDIKNDIVAAVGLEYNQAEILIGKR